MNCICGAWAWLEDAGYGETERVCLVGHRIAINPKQPLALIKGDMRRDARVPETISYYRKRMG